VKEHEPEWEAEVTAKLRMRLKCQYISTVGARSSAFDEVKEGSILLVLRGQRQRANKSIDLY
jgi:hypothetical protein